MYHSFVYINYIYIYNIYMLADCNAGCAHYIVYSVLSTDRVSPISALRRPLPRDRPDYWLRLHSLEVSSGYVVSMPIFAVLITSFVMSTFHIYRVVRESRPSRANPVKNRPIRLAPSRRPASWVFCPFLSFCYIHRFSSSLLFVSFLRLFSQSTVYSRQSRSSTRTLPFPFLLHSRHDPRIS